MSINPRVPSRNKAGILAGPVAKGILETLQESPEQMVLKNLGIYLLVDRAFYNHTESQLQLSFTDKGLHGIVNGGHTYAAIMQAIEQAEPSQLERLNEAFVRLNVYEGIEADMVAEMAEGQNRSKQVDDPSLANLQGEFDLIRKALKGLPGASTIAYHQGDTGDLYVSELLVMLELLNPLRYSDKKHPNALYNRRALGLRFFQDDMQAEPKLTKALIELLPSILKLADRIRLETPAAANRAKLKFGRVKVSSHERAGSQRPQALVLPFIGATTGYRVPQGWVWPMLAAFRANLAWDGHKLSFIEPLEKLIPSVINDLVAVCVAEHKDSGGRPELVGKREAAYSRCYAVIELYLAKRGLLGVGSLS